MRRLIFHLFIFYCLLNTGFVTAQGWTGKIIVIHPDRMHRDSVYIGCHPNGGWGWQDSLDVLDSPDLSTPVRIAAYDDLVQMQKGGPCGNMQKDIREFKARQDFKMFIYSDTFPPLGGANQQKKAVNLSWAKSDFQFKQGKIELREIWLHSNSAIFENFIDADSIPIFSNTGGGFDSVRVRLFNQFWGCSPYQMDITVQVYFDINTDVNTTSLPPQMNLYPNPVQNTLYLQQAENKRWQVRISDVRGKVLLSEMWQGTTGSLDLQNLAPGYYLMEIQNTDDHQVFQKKIIKH